MDAEFSIMPSESQESAVEQAAAMDVAKYIDHTLLKAEATQAEILRICDEAVAYGFHAVCVNGRWVSLVADRLQQTVVQVAGVVSLPLGADTTKIKAVQAQDAIYAGADEIDMVADLAAVIEGDARYLLDQLMMVLRVCRVMRPAVLLKVIIESAVLTHDQKVFACQIAQEAGVDFVKTSTGFHPAGGATIEDVRLMKESAPKCKVKAAGGIKTAQQALAMLSAGADRIGTSAGVAIIEEIREHGRGIHQ
jgi:deoxyribose-phosphate aldolase